MLQHYRYSAALTVTKTHIPHKIMFDNHADVWLSGGIETRKEINMTDVTLMNNTTNCIVRQDALNGKIIHNICNGTETFIPYAVGDIVGMALIGLLLLSLVLMMIGLFVMMVKL